MRATEPLTPHDLTQDPALSDWRVVLGRLRTRFKTRNFATGARLVAAITEIAEELNHHPDVDLRYRHLDVTTVSHDVEALTARDKDLATRISAVARELGVNAAPGQVVVVEIGLDLRDAATSGPFWAAVLGLDLREDGTAVEDPADRIPLLWFQEMTHDPAREQPRGRFHLDVNVPRELAEQRVQAALDAGGRLVTDEFAPSWWVLADPEGNEACVCTWQGREGSGES